VNKHLFEEEFFKRVAEIHLSENERAPSRLKARLYSALVRTQAETGPLLSLPATKAAGHDLCPFEELVCIAPIGETAKCLNICRVCHARVLAEHFEDPPIWWPHCPYVRFKKA
jgi:hypothetical protein